MEYTLQNTKIQNPQYFFDFETGEKDKIRWDFCLFLQFCTCTKPKSKKYCGFLYFVICTPLGPTLVRWRCKNRDEQRRGWSVRRRKLSRNSLSLISSHLLLCYHIPSHRPLYLTILTVKSARRVWRSSGWRSSYLPMRCEEQRDSLHPALPTQEKQSSQQGMFDIVRISVNQRDQL